MAISDLLYRIALARSGAGNESTLDKLNKTFQTIGGLGKQMGDWGAQQSANQLRALQMEKERAELAKVNAETAQKTQENKTYFSGLNIPEPGAISQERQFGERTVPGRGIAGSPSSPSESPILEKQVYVKSEPIIQTEQVSREQYETTPFAKQIPYEAARIITNKQFNESLGKYLFKPEASNVKYLYDEDGNIVSAVPKGSAQLLPSTVDLFDPRTGKPITKVGRQAKPANVTEETKTDAQDKVLRNSLATVDDYYDRLVKVQGNVSSTKDSLIAGSKGAISRIPVAGRAMLPPQSSLEGYRQSQGAAVAKANGDVGNISLSERKSALELFAPQGTKTVELDRAQATKKVLEGIRNRTPEEEQRYQNAVKTIETSNSNSEQSETPVLDIPKPGTEDNGFIFIGGNPASSSSWREK